MGSDYLTVFNESGTGLHLVRPLRATASELCSSKRLDKTRTERHELIGRK